jgi:Protein of unknown function (DUF1761)
MHPEIHINYLSVVAAVAASFFFGFLWYGPLFGKRWMQLMGMPTEGKPETKIMLRGMALMIIGTFLTSYVMVHASEIWRPSVWGVGQDAPPCIYGFFNGFFTWIGFFVPMQLSMVAWEKRSWRLCGLNSVYHFLNLQIIAMILAYLR